MSCMWATTQNNPQKIGKPHEWNYAHHIFEACFASNFSSVMKTKSRARLKTRKWSVVYGFDLATCKRLTVTTILPIISELGQSIWKYIRRLFETSIRLLDWALVPIGLKRSPSQVGTSESACYKVYGIYFAQVSVWMVFHLNHAEGRKQWERKERRNAV